MREGEQLLAPGSDDISLSLSASVVVVAYSVIASVLCADVSLNVVS